MRVRGNWFVVALGVGLLVLAGCGGDDDDNGDGNGDGTASVRQGTWSVTTTTTTSGSGAQCDISPETETTSEVICDDGDLVGDSESGELPCTIDINGNHVSIDCDITTPVGNCVMTVGISGGGTFTDTSYDITIDLTTTVSPNTAECSILGSPCVQHTHVVGTWQSSAGDCSSAPLPIRRALSHGVHQAVVSR